MNLFCKVFVDAGVPLVDLEKLVADAAAAISWDWTSIVCNDCSMYIRKNDDFEPGVVDDFLRYRYYIDIDPLDVQNVDAYVRRVSNCLEALWANGFEAVAACDFEDELPQKGGLEGRL